MLARRPRERPAANVYSTPVPGETTTTSDVTRKAVLTRLLLPDRLLSVLADDERFEDGPRRALAADRSPLLLSNRRRFVPVPAQVRLDSRPSPTSVSDTAGPESAQIRCTSRATW